MSIRKLQKQSITIEENLQSLLDEEIILKELNVQLGQTVLDAGGGNGYMAKNFADLVKILVKFMRWILMKFQLKLCPWKQVDPEERTAELINQSDLLFVTSSTFINGTASKFIVQGKKTIFYVVSGAAQTCLLDLERYCHQ